MQSYHRLFTYISLILISFLFFTSETFCQKLAINELIKDYPNISFYKDDFYLGDFYYKDKTQLHKFSENKSKASLVAIWALWCNSCRKEIPILAKFAAENTEPNFKVLAVNIDSSSEDKLSAFLKENKAENLTNFRDKDNQLYAELRRRFIVTNLPTLLLFDNKQHLKFIIKGDLQKNQAAIKKLLKYL